MTVLRACVRCGRPSRESYWVSVTSAIGSVPTGLTTWWSSRPAAKHRDPEWAKERVEKALAVLGARA
jgi:hypothetical protein